MYNANLHVFYKKNFTRKRNSFFKIQEQIKNNPSLSRRTKSQIFKLKHLFAIKVVNKTAWVTAAQLAKYILLHAY